MAAYVIAEVETSRSEGSTRSTRKRVPATIAQYGGKLPRCAAAPWMPKEGGWSPKRVVVLEFPSMEQARKWYDSPEYAPALAMRARAATSKLILVEGV